MEDITSYSFNFVTLLPQIMGILNMTVLFVVLFTLAKWALEIITPYKISAELTEKDNAALAISYCGYFIGITIIFIGALLGPSEGMFQDLLNVGLYTLMGIVLLNLSHIINDKLILHTFVNEKELIEDQNAGTGIVQFGSYVASGLIIAGSIHGEGGGVDTAIVFFLLGQVALIIFSKIYNLITPFNIHDELEQDNVAVGAAFGGTLVALGIILMNAAQGDFESWTYNLSLFVIKALIAFILLPLFRWLLDKIFINHADLNHEISVDKNLGAGILEMANAIGFASILFFLLA